MFDLDGLPDSLVHAQFKVQSTTPLAAGATREGVIVISALRFKERPDVTARFALLERLTMGPVAGLHFEWENVRGEEAAQPRDGEVRMVWVRFRNETNAPLTFSATLTMAGYPIAPRPSGGATPAPVLPAWTDETLVAKSMSNVTLAQAWRALQSQQLGEAAYLNVGTSAGTVAPGDSVNSPNVIRAFQHFLNGPNGTLYDDSGPYQSNGTHVGRANPFGVPTPDGALGIVALSMSSAAVGATCALWTDAMFFAVQQEFSLEARLQVSNLATNVDPYYFKIGFSDNLLNLAPNRSFGYFTYNLQDDGPTWTCSTCNSSSITTVDTFVPVTTDWVILKIEVPANAAADGVGVTFKINDEVVAVIDTNVPYHGFPYTQNCQQVITMVSQGLTNRKEIKLDWTDTIARRII